MPPARGLLSREITASTYRRVTTLALFLLAAIVVTGAAVRLTGSGLGCSDWPRCHQESFVSQGQYHDSIEFLNRLFTGAVSVSVILAVLGSMRRTPRRRDLTWWSWGLVAGVLAQIVLGGLVVIFELTPWLVIGHFVLSMVLVWNAVVLRNRAGHDGASAPPRVSAATLNLARVVVLGAMAAIMTGTLVTGSGPHGGDEEVERLPFLIHTVARVHGGVVMGFLALVLLVGWRLRRDGARRMSAAPTTPDSRPMTRGYTTLLVVLVAQAAIGYTQYFTDVPALLVGFHIAGATALWIAVVSFYLGLFAWRPEPAAATTLDVRHRSTPESAMVTP